MALKKENSFLNFDTTPAPSARVPHVPRVARLKSQVSGGRREASGAEGSLPHVLPHRPQTETTFHGRGGLAVAFFGPRLQKKA